MKGEYLALVVLLAADVMFKNKVYYTKNYLNINVNAILKSLPLISTFLYKGALKSSSLSSSGLARGIIPTSK